jgi:hypothetical protein
MVFIESIPYLAPVLSLYDGKSQSRRGMPQGPNNLVQIFWGSLVGDSKKGLYLSSNWGMAEGETLHTQQY